MIEKSLFGKYPISVERKMFGDILDETMVVFPSMIVPFLLTDRQKAIDGLRNIKAKMEAIGV